MKEKERSEGSFDPSGNYTGKYIKQKPHGDVVVPTTPEQDADDL